MDYFRECDEEPTWTEIKEALKETPKNKAAGEDGIPSEIWKIIQSDEDPDS
ncbi:hypothetical protein AX774_g3855, partial [Zancudomyces culisetae]